eukprot:Nitzschia sp. Nitz4//scaffold120_size68122//38190//41441//NITZ4_006047-RA/size68122-processed-gene-0.37-mRNA-1//1//CDS//3329534287//110//frame0
MSMNSQHPWLNQPALVWEASNPTNPCSYWDPQDWFSSTTTTGTKGTTSTTTTVSYQSLLSITAALVAELQYRIHHLSSKLLESQDWVKYGIPIVVAIPEGPWLPVAILAVHALNHPFGRTTDNPNGPTIHAVVIPLEPTEGLERNRRIVQDIQPPFILTVPGTDADRIQLLLDTTETYIPCQLLNIVDLVDTSVQSIAPLGNILASKMTADEKDLSLQELVAIMAAGEQEHILTTSPPNRVSHIVYTSGTTGHPKGCISSIASLRHYIREKNQVYSISPSSTVLLASALSFDPCLSDILASFYAHATLALAPRTQLVTRLPGILQALQVSHVLCTPTLWGMMVQEDTTMASPQAFPSLQVVALGGEPIPPLLVQTWARRTESADAFSQSTNCRLFATYGVTEACVYQTAGEICLPTQTSQDSQLGGQWVGPPFSGLNVRICVPPVENALSPLEDVPVSGQPGEVVLSGNQLDNWSGYWRRPELSAKFVAETAQGEAGTSYFYRTGDMGVVDPYDGTLRIIGRIAGEEGMVKVNGVRVELGEIEAALTDGAASIQGQGSSDSKLPDPPMMVASCLALVVAGDQTTSTRSEIHAYIVLTENALKELALPSREELPPKGLLVTNGILLVLLRARCQARIKAACMPTVFIILPRLPLAPTGKRDRKNLPSVSECQIMDTGSSSGTPLQDYGVVGAFLAKTIGDCLNLQPLQRGMLTTAITFDMIGGDSLAATRVIRALYAFHHQVDNTRYLGGDYGKFDGPFDVLHLLRAKSLGDYVDMLMEHNIGSQSLSEGVSPHVSAESSEDIQDEPDSKEEDKGKSALDKALYDALLETTTLGHSSLAIALLHAGANPNFGDHGKRLGKVSGGFFYRKMAFHSSPLHLACMKGDDVLVQHLLHMGARSKSPDASGLFPIHLAASSLDGTESRPEEDERRLRIVQYLLDAGTPLVMRDGNHQTILHAAARSGHSALLQYYMLLWKESGKESPNTPVHKRFVNWLDRWFRTPVHWSILNGRVEALETCLSLGCTATPYKPKTGKRTSVAMEYPMELCDRLYPPDDTSNAEKHSKGERMRQLLRDAIERESQEKSP